MKCLGILFLICNLLSHKSLSQKVIILNNEETFVSGTYTSLFQDPTGKLSIDDIILRSDQFIPSEKEVILSTKTSYTFWVKLIVKNDFGGNLDLVVENPYLNRIELFALDSNKIETIAKTGNISPFYTRPVLKNNFIFPVNIPYGKKKTFYIRYNSNWRLELPVFIRSSKRVIENESLKDIWYGFFYGIILVTLIYVFFIYLMIKDNSYIYFLLFVLSVGFLRSLNHGFSFQFLFPNKPQLNNFFIYIILSLMPVLMIRFTQLFLKTRTHSKWLFKVEYLIILFMIINFMISFFNSNLWFYSMNFWYIIIAIYLLVVGLKLYIKGFTPARFYLVSAIVYSFSLIISIIRNFGFLSYSFFLYNIADVLFATSCICFSLAIGDRYNEIDKEKNDTQYQLNKELELKIAERTRATLEEKRLNENLGQSLSLLSATLEATADGILVVDSKGKITGFNHKFVEMWRIPDSIIKSKDDQMALGYVLDQLTFPHSFIDKVEQLYAQPQEESFDVLEFKDGKTFERYSKPQMLGNQIVGRVWSFRDVTDRKQAEDQVNQLNKDLNTKVKDLMEAEADLKKANLELRQTNTDLDNFIYAASHNVKGPASSLEGLINLLDLGIYSAEELPGVISMMKSLMVKFNQTIIDLTELSRVQNIIESKDVITFSIAEVINEVLEELKVRIENEHAIIYKDFDDVNFLLFSKLNFKRIMFNLLSNALKFRSPNRVLEIFIKSYETAEYIVISIQDNGLGIASFNQEKIFQMFKRAHDHIEGRGIGLYIVKRIIENSGGKIEVESTEGKGSVFRVFFKKDKDF